MAIIRFGAEGWRSRVDEDFTDANVCRVADALGAAWAEAGDMGAVLVGYDTRRDARSHAALAAEVLSSWGFDARVSEGFCPIPALGWTAAHDEGVIGAVMIGASGAPAGYQGVCVRDADGLIAPDEFLARVESLVPGEASDSRGACGSVALLDTYISELERLVDADAISAARPRIVVDPMYGTSRGILAGMLRRLGADVIEIHGDDRTDFAGLHPRPVEPWVDDCEQAVMSSGACAGLVLDGDADRIGLVDEKGRFVSTHRLYALVMGHLVETRGMSGRVAMPLNGSTYVRRQAKRLGCRLSVLPIGFSHTYRDMLRPDALMAVGETGGLSIPMHFAERDAMLVALLVTELLSCSGMTASELVDNLVQELGSLWYGQHDLRLDPAQIQTFRNVLPGLNPPVVCGRESVAVSHADGLRMEMEDGSWLLLRPSRTEALVRVYAEAGDAAERDELLVAGCEIARGSGWDR